MEIPQRISHKLALLAPGFFSLRRNPLHHPFRYS
jgi:hypothetical protein